MLSILIPTYNYSIKPLVHQLLLQAEHLSIPFEIVVVDDASTDGVKASENESILEWESCRYLKLPENKGRTFVRNYLANEAVFDTLLFLDADVLPKKKTFLKEFIDIRKNADVVFGGIVYTKTPPEKNKILRWKYGSAREAKSISERAKKPYLAIISGCSLIRKDIFLKANDFLENRYGLDVLFTYNLSKLKARVLHIDNPVIHYGLEDNKTFLEKTKKAVQSIAYFEEKEMIPNDFRPIQKAYLKLKKWRLTAFFQFIIWMFHPFIKLNLLSSNPSLFLFDIYRLRYFVFIKKNLDA